MKKLSSLLKESQYLDYRRLNIGEDGLGNTEMTPEEKLEFLEAVASYRKIGEAIYHNGNLIEAYENIKKIVETAQILTLKETTDWFDKVTVNRHMKSMNESFKVFSNTIKEVAPLQQRLESTYDEIGEVLSKYYEIREGNTFGAERAKAIAGGESSFNVDGKQFKVTGVDAADKQNAKQFVGENMSNMKLSSFIKNKRSVNEANDKLMKVGATMMVGGDGSGMVKPVKMKLVSIDYLPKEDKYSYKFQGGGRTQYYTDDVLAKKLKESVNEAADKPHIKKIDSNLYYVDTPFVQYSNKFGNLIHIGGGDFTLETPNGKVYFTRALERTHKDMPVSVGRVHSMTGDAAAVKKVVALMSKKYKLEESVNAVLVYKINEPAVEKFLKKYPRVNQIMKTLVTKNKDVMRGYKAFLKLKDSSEDYLGGRAEVSSSPTFGTKTFYKYDWNGVGGWAEVYQYLYNQQNESVNEAKVIVHNEKTGEKHEVLSGKGKGDLLIAMKALQSAAPSHMKYSIKENQSVNETKFYAFWGNKKHEIEGKDLWDAKQKAIAMLKVPKSKVGYLAVVNAKEHDGGSFMYEKISEDLSAELPKATIPAAIEQRLALAIQKIESGKLNFNQKIHLLAKVVDALNVDKTQLGTLTSKIKSKMESYHTPEEEVSEGNEFGAERAKAIAAGKDSFTVDGKTYKVTDVDPADKKNAEEFANESMKLSTLLKKKSLSEATARLSDLLKQVANGSTSRIGSTKVDKKTAEKLLKIYNSGDVKMQNKFDGMSIDKVISSFKPFMEKFELTTEVAPEGWEGTVKAMKDEPGIDNPYALAWWMKGKGYKSHKE